MHLSLRSPLASPRATAERAGRGARLDPHRACDRALVAGALDRAAFRWAAQVIAQGIEVSKVKNPKRVDTFAERQKIKGQKNKEI